jgi:hypothetical protein
MRSYRALFGGAALCLGACSSGAQSIIGEWTYNEPIGGDSVSWFFNNDGTTGLIITADGQRSCRTTCTYTYGHDEIVFSCASEPELSRTVQVSVSANTLTIDYGADAGGPEQFSRVNASGTNTCP